MRDERHFSTNRGWFQKGNQLAAKPKMSAVRIANFRHRLRTLQEFLAFNDKKFARSLGFSLTYLRTLRGDYPHRQQQPSKHFLQRLKEVERTASPSPNKWEPGEDLTARAETIWSHVLAKRFKCPDCAAEVRRGKRPKGLEYWWGRTPNQKHCDEHAPKPKNIPRHRK